MKKAYIILILNTLVVSALSVVLSQKTHTLYPWHNVVMFVFSSYVATITIISSYFAGKTIFKSEGKQILSLGFFLTSTGFILLSIFIVGLNLIIKQFDVYSFVNNFAIFSIAYIAIPLLTARPYKLISKSL